MGPPLHSVPLSGLISACEGTGLSVRPPHASPPELTRKPALHRARGGRAPGFSCTLRPGALARASDAKSHGGLNCFGSVARADHGRRITCPKFISTWCKPGPCSPSLLSHQPRHSQAAAPALLPPSQAVPSPAYLRSCCSGAKPALPLTAIPELTSKDRAKGEVPSQDFYFMPFCELHTRDLFKARDALDKCFHFTCGHIQIIGTSWKAFRKQIF